MRRLKPSSNSPHYTTVLRGGVSSGGGGGGGTSLIPFAQLKPSVASAAALPASGNAAGDVRETLDDKHVHLWDGTAWVDNGVVSSVSAIGYAADDGDRPAAPTDGEMVFNEGRRSIDRFNRAEGRWESVGDISIYPTVADLPSWMSKGDIAYVDSVDALFVLADDPASPGNLAWKQVGAGFLPLTGGTLHPTASDVPTLNVMASPGRTGTVQEWQDDSGVQLGHWDADGRLFIGAQPLRTHGTNMSFGGGHQKLTAGTGNTAVGVHAQMAVTAGTENNAFGYRTQEALTTGRYNIAFGNNAQVALTIGKYNNAVGYHAQAALATGTGNNAFGYNTQVALTSGDFNIAVGYNAQGALSRGAGNVAVGAHSQESMTTGAGNTAVGTHSQELLTTGAGDTAVGSRAQEALSTGGSSTAVGNRAQSVVGPKLNSSPTTYTLTPDPDFIYKVEGTKLTGPVVAAVFDPPDATPVTFTATGGLVVSKYLTPKSSQNTVAVGANAYTTADDQIQLGDNTKTLTLKVGSDSYTSNATLKSAIAGASSWADFQTWAASNL